MHSCAVCLPHPNLLQLESVLRRGPEESCSQSSDAQWLASLYWDALINRTTVDQTCNNIQNLHACILYQLLTLGL